MRTALLIFCLLPFLVNSQQASIADIQFDKGDTIPQAYRPLANTRYIFIASRFASDEVLRSSLLDSVQGFSISRIDLVFSGYHKANTFNQQKLNDKRWQNLLSIYPTLFSGGFTHYRNVCQSNGEDSVARKLSHGFFIYFENRADPVERASEITELSKMLDKMGINVNDTVDHDPEEDKRAAGSDAEVSLRDLKTRGKFRKPMRTVDPHACRQPYYDGGRDGLDRFFAEQISLRRRQRRRCGKISGSVRLRLDYNGEIKSAMISAPGKRLARQLSGAVAAMNAWNPAIRNGVTVKSDVKFKLRCAEGHIALDGDVEVPRNLMRCGTAPDEDLFDFSAPRARESMIPKVFEVSDKELLRHVIERNPTLDSLLVVVDLTGSMGPYIAQVLDLMSDLVVKNDPLVCCFSLFNDGNTKPDNKKQIGKTGGITILKDNITLDKLGKSIIKTMRAGDGGDAPENDMEALLDGLGSCKDCRDVIMVADNYATPRDRELLRQVRRPVHWILCGVEGEINVHYLDMVRQNRGFLHTNKSDISDLHLLQEGGIVTIDGIQYRLTGGKFRRLKVT